MSIEKSVKKHLSIDKIYGFVSGFGAKTLKIYHMNDEVRFITILPDNDDTEIVINIPTKYRVPVSNSLPKSVQFINIKKHSKQSELCTTFIDIYKGTEIVLDDSQVNIFKHYDQHIKFDKIDIGFRNIYSQILRLYNMMKNIDFNIVFVYNNYMFAVYPRNVDVYTIPNVSETYSKYMMTNLSDLYKDRGVVFKNVKKVNKILTKTISKLSVDNLSITNNTIDAISKIFNGAVSLRENERKTLESSISRRKKQLQNKNSDSYVRDEIIQKLVLDVHKLDENILKTELLSYNIAYHMDCIRKIIKHA